MIDHPPRFRLAAICAVATFALGALAPAALAAADYEQVQALMSPVRKERKAAAQALLAAKDRSLMPGIVDALFFIGPNDRAEAYKVLEGLAGEKISRGYRDWVDWIGRQTSLEPKEGYAAWKLTLLERIDARYRNIFYQGAPARIRLEEVIWGGVPIDGIPSLDDPLTIPAADARYLRDGELVFGVDLGGEQRAYPLRMMDWHEMANDVVGGRPVTLSYCTLCRSGVLYDARTKAGGAYRFGTSGLLYRSNKLMFDRQSWSLWSNITGEAVIGRAAVGERSLPLLPMTLTTWGEWRARHPATTTLALEQPSNRVGFDYRPGLADRARANVRFPVWQKSDALKEKDEIYALVVDGRPKAYPLDRLRAEGVVNDRVGERALVLITDAESGAVRVYERGERTFRATDGALVDDAGQTWRLTEQALVPAGDGAESLARVPGHVAYWFGWYGFYPQTEVYDG